MYCKYCGKQIDDDSKFCKECGKNLDADITNSFNSFSIIKIRQHFVAISIIVIWYALTTVFTFGVYHYSERDESTIGVLFLLWITPLLYLLIYNLINKYSKCPIKLWSNTDKIKTKLFKSAYLIYSYFVPFGCCEHNQVDEYLSLMFVCWLIPSILIYLLYYLKCSKDNVGL